MTKRRCKHSGAPGFLLLAALLLLRAGGGPTLAAPGDLNSVFPPDQRYEVRMAYRETSDRASGARRVAILDRAYQGRSLVAMQITANNTEHIEKLREKLPILGMNGSPVYVTRPTPPGGGAAETELVGAVSMASADAREGYVVVTPVSLMEPSADVPPAGYSPFANRAAYHAASSSAAGIYPAPEDVPGGISKLSYKPIALPVFVSGLSDRNLERAARALRPFNLAVMRGGGALDKAGDKQAYDDLAASHLDEGDAFGIVLMRGAIWMTAAGTVTQVRKVHGEDGFVALGHPFMGLGSVRLPVTKAYVHEVIPGQPSYQMVSPWDWKGPDPTTPRSVGTLVADGPFGVAVQFTPGGPEMLPVTCKVTPGSASADSHTYKVEIARHPLVVNRLVPLLVSHALSLERPAPREEQATVTLTVALSGVSAPIVRRNVYFDPLSIDSAVAADLEELLQVLADNPFRPLDIQEVTIDIQLGQPTPRPPAEVEGMDLLTGSAAPGEAIAATLRLRPFRGAPVERAVRLMVPPDAAPGPALLVARGGATQFDLVRSPGGLPAASLPEYLAQLQHPTQSNEAVLHLIFQSRGFTVNGTSLANLPPPLARTLGGSPGVLDPAEPVMVSSQAVPLDYMLRGVQTRVITIRRRDPREAPPPTSRRTPGLGVVRFRVDGKDQEVNLAAALQPELPAAAAPVPTSTPALAVGTPIPILKQADGTLLVPRPESRGRRVLARPVQIWSQRTPEDFQRGDAPSTEIQGVAAISTGGIGLGTALTRLYPPDAAAAPASGSVLSVAAGGGVTYAGTANGRVLRIDAAGVSSVLLETEPCLSLAVSQSGTLYAGTGGKGRLFRIRPPQAAQEIVIPFDLTGPQPTSRQVYALALGSDDQTLYIGTGPPAEVWRVRPGAAQAERVASLPALAAFTLTPAREGAGQVLYTGTALDGGVFAVYPDPPATAPKVLYSAGNDTITGVVPDASGTVYAASDSGEIYRIEADGTRRSLASLGVPLHGLFPVRDDSVAHRLVRLYTCGANHVFQVEMDGTYRVSTASGVEAFLSMAQYNGERFALGTGGASAIFSAERAKSGLYTSHVHDAEQPASWGRISFDVRPPEGAVTIETRSGNTPIPDSTWSEPQAAITTTAGDLVAVAPRRRYFQYLARFHSDTSFADLHGVSFAYQASNGEPELVLLAPGAGEWLRGKAAIRWSVSDPDGDTLSHRLRLEYSPDGGRTWVPPTAAAAHRLPEKAVEEALTAYEERLRADPDLKADPRALARFLRHAREAINRLKETEQEHEPRDPAGGIEQIEARQAGTTQLLTATLDTTRFPDGLYRVSLKISDAPSDPTTALEIERHSDPFLVSNLEPGIFLFERSARLVPDGVSYAFGFVFNSAPIQGGQFRSDVGPWSAFVPTETRFWSRLAAPPGTWDRPFQPIRIAVGPDRSGRRALDLKLVDRARNARVKRLRVRVPEPGGQDHGS